MDEINAILWRLATDISVENAAILIAGGDPSEKAYPEGSMPFKDGVVKVKVTNGHLGFDAVFAALKAAVICGDLRAQLSYYATEAPIGLETPYDPHYVVFAGSELQGKLPSALVIFEDGKRTVVIADKPIWAEALIHVADLKVWLQERGLNSGFFFPVSNPNSAEFMDPSHDHFSPELALAVAAWRGLANEQIFPKGQKAAVENWIAKHPGAWLGKGKPSDNAKDRIATLVNWNPIGGAPKTGG